MSSQLHRSEDTIAALATPIGVGGISVIRISGKEAITSVHQIFKGKASLLDAPSHTIHYGTITSSSGTIIDAVLISVFRNPHSYTGEDVIEISCHGGYFVSKTILDTVTTLGIRIADPGEFTQRAFLNGKLDLAQAEAVADIINAKTGHSHRTSIQQLEGRLSRYTEGLRKEILDLCSLLELELDFSSEGIELAEKSDVEQKLNSILKRLKEIISTYSIGKHTRDGIRIALVGKPNAGKSSLLNALLEEERAIVSHIPGTTRDTIEESMIINGLEFVFTDTAGLRESGDVIELEGIKRTSSKVQKSDIVCVVVDSSEIVSDEDIDLYSRVQEMLPANAKKIYLFNKNDIINPSFSASATKIRHPSFKVSCKTGEGIKEFIDSLTSMALPLVDTTEGSIVINNLRHKTAFEKSSESLNLALQSLKDGLSDDFIAVDLRRGADALGEIIGITTPDDILNNIFANFCIGK